LGPFYTAIVKITDHSKFKEICDKIKYFELEGKMCRAIPFSKDLKGTNREKANKECNIFVKNIGKGVSHKELDQRFSEIFGDSKSVRHVKVGVNDDHSFRNYGFVMVNDPKFILNIDEISEKSGCIV